MINRQSKNKIVPTASPVDSHYRIILLNSTTATPYECNEQPLYSENIALFSLWFMVRLGTAYPYFPGIRYKLFLSHTFGEYKYSLFADVMDK